MNYSDLLNINYDDVDIDKEYYYHFNEPINLTNLDKTNICFADCFNHPVNNKLPTILIKLVFGREFNQNIDHLPQKLQYLSLGFNFNQPINNLPHTLTFLSLTGNFKHNFDFLPESLITLDIKRLINNIKINDLPSGIQKIIVKAGKENNINKIYKDKIEIYNPPKRNMNITK